MLALREGCPLSDAELAGMLRILADFQIFSDLRFHSAGTVELEGERERASESERARERERERSSVFSENRKEQACQTTFFVGRSWTACHLSPTSELQGESNQLPRAGSVGPGARQKKQTSPYFNTLAFLSVSVTSVDSQHTHTYYIYL